MDLKISMLVTYDEGTPLIKSRGTSAMWSRNRSKTLYVHFHKAYGLQD